MEFPEKIVQKLTNQEMEVDRISNLPNHILLHIMSSLPINEIVATGILSKTWKDVWTGIDALDLRHSVKRKKSMEYYTSFENFMDKVCLSDDACCLQKLEFDICEGFNPTHFSGWVNSLMKRGVKKLMLENESGKVIVFPESWFACQELIELNLSYGFNISFPASLDFPNLKAVHLYKIHLDGGSLKNLLLGSPTLEVLVIEYCQGEGNLDLNSCSMKSFDCSGWFGDVAIDTPNLEFLRLSEKTAVCSITSPNLRVLILNFLTVTHYHMDDMPLLVEATLTINGDGQKVAEILRKVRTSITLWMDCATIGYLGDNFSELLEFSNLTCLEVELCNWRAVSRVLELAPKLKTFYASFDCGEELDWVRPAVVPECLQFLDEIKLESFDLDDFTRPMLRFFLMKAKSLKKMIVQVDMDVKREKISRALKKIPKISTGCEIIVR